MVTMTIYVDAKVFGFIYNIINNSISFGGNGLEEVSVKKKRKFPYEVQVPLQTIGPVINKKRTTINLHILRELSESVNKKKC